MLSLRLCLVLAALALIPGCGALSSLTEASADLNAYTLSPLAAAGPPAGGSRHLIVEMPTSGGALATDRILIKPLPYQAQYLSDGRWTEPAPALVQTLLVASFQTVGGFRLVGRGAVGLMPDYTLMTELQAFEAEPAGPAQEPLIVRVAANMTLIREADRQIVAVRRFDATAQVATDATPDLIAGFDRAVRDLLAEAVVWTVASAR